MRDLRIDTLRGLLLIIMTVDHMYGWVRQYSYQSLGYISAAEGFVFMSGLVGAYVYSRSYSKPALPPIIKRMWKRCAEIYGWHVAMFVLIMLAIFLFPAYAAEIGASPYITLEKAYANFWSFFWFGYGPYYFDILPMYVVFMGLAPFVIYGWDKGLFWPLIGASVALWLSSVTGFLSLRGPDGCRAFCAVAYFDMLSWQLLFVTGMALGWRWARNRPQVPRSGWLFAAALAICTVFFLHRWQIWEVPYFPKWWTLYESRSIISAWRITNFLAFCYVLYYPLTRYFERTSQIRPLSYLGSYSLQVFSLHILLVYTYGLLFFQKPVALTETLGTPANLILFDVGGVLLLFPMIWTYLNGKAAVKRWAASRRAAEPA